nr:hypothetical protein [Tanacetum cinerariifolium]
EKSKKIDLHVLIMKKGFLTANGRWNVVLNEEPKSRNSLGGKHNVGSVANPNLGTATDRASTPSKDANLNNTNVGPVSFVVTQLKGNTSQKSISFRALVTLAGNG